jgi:hypothetical protein
LVSINQIRARRITGAGRMGKLKRRLNPKQSSLSRKANKTHAITYQTLKQPLKRCNSTPKMFSSLETTSKKLGVSMTKLLSTTIN